MAYYSDEPADRTYEELIYSLMDEIRSSDAVVVGAGHGLSDAAGFAYSGGRLQRYFSDFAEKYGFTDMYDGGFSDYKTLEEYWAYWSRHIYINRFLNPVLPAYDQLLELIKDKDYFVITTNLDHCFQKAGFDKDRLFYTQGDYGLWQCSDACHNATYDNEEIVSSMVMNQGYVINTDGRLIAPENEDGSVDFSKLKMTVMQELIPYCPVCGKPMCMNMRIDEYFVEDSGRHEAEERYRNFLEIHKNQKVLFLELGVGLNTPGVIKYDFWRMADGWLNARYACVNLGDITVPDVLKRRAICIKANIRDVLNDLTYISEQEEETVNENPKSTETETSSEIPVEDTEEKTE